MIPWHDPRTPQHRKWLRERWLPLKATTLYGMVAFFWLIVASAIVEHPLSNIVEDILFITFTCFLIYLVVSGGVRTLRAKESALRESEDRLARILETNVGGIAVFDVTGTVTFANHAASEILGVERSRITGLRHDDPVWGTADADGEPPGKSLSPVLQVRATRMPVYDVHFSVRHGNGNRVFLTMNAAPLLDTSGNMAGIVTSFTDITERKKSEDLKVRKLLLAAEQSPSAIVITDLDGNVEYANSRYIIMTGCTVKEVLGGKTPHCCKIPERELEEMRAVVRSGKAWRGEFECLRMNGEFYWEATSVTPIRTEEGETTNLLWVREDVTDRKMAEEALRRSEANLRISEERFRQLFEQNEEPLFLFRGGSPEMIDVNPAAVHLYGYSREELVRGGLSLFARPAEISDLSSAISAIRSSNVLSIERATHFRKDGARIIVSIRGKSIRTEHGHVSYCSFRDITSRIRMEEEAKLHHAQLIHANRMASLGTIVSGVAHEINNPNNLVMFNSPMILSAWEDAVPVLDTFFRENGDFSLGGLPYSEMREVMPKLAAGISDASARIKTIVENLKDFGRQDIPHRQAPVPINDVVRMAITILNHEILRATHRFEVEYGEDLPPVMGSARKLEQVVINLLNNALQALPSSRHGLRVTTRRTRGTGDVEVCVADEGVGMSPEVLERIKEPFYSTHLDSGGLGLGVSICRSIVREHNGTLDFESEVGKGTRAVIRFPGIGVTIENGAETVASKIPTGR